MKLYLSFGAVLALALTLFVHAEPLHAAPPATSQQKGAATGADAMAMAIMIVKSATEYKNANISDYDCSIPTVTEKNGKCTMRIEAGGKTLNLTASPEVAAPWGFSYGPPEARPMTNLSVYVLHDGEIVMIRDANGKRISGKVDFNR